MSDIQLKIKKVSKIFRILFQISFVLVPIKHIIAWIYAPTSLLFPMGIVIDVIPQNIEILHSLAVSTKFYGFLVSALPVIALEIVLFYLIRLFRLYERAEIFTLQNVNYIKKMGYALFIMQPLRLISEGLVSAIVTWNNPIGSGTRKSVITMTGVDLSLMLAAFLIILISWIMTEGYRLREEQKFTI